MKLRWSDLAKLDHFGHGVSLNYDKNGKSYNTPVGGLFSTLISLFLFGYTLALLKKMILFEGNVVQSTALHIETSGKQVNLSETRYNLYFNIKTP